MKLHAFHATDGDCLLLESAKGRRVLIDGGRTASFEDGTRPVLDSLRDANKAIDLVVVSHIDADHISGIIPLLDGVGQWVAFEHRRATSSRGERAKLKEPKLPKPPEISAVWHNSWRQQLGDLVDPAGNLAQAVGAAVEIAFGANIEDVPNPAARALANLATSMAQGEDLMNLIDGAGVPIPFNQPFDGMVMLQDPIHVETLGDLKLSVLGPMQEHLDTLREEWQAWVDKLGAGRGAARGRQGIGDGLSVGDVPLDTARQESEELLDNLANAAKVDNLPNAAQIITEADGSNVTPPNRASIILLAEEKGRTCLLTGDAAEPEVIDGLTAAGRLTDDKPFRCNVVKVQHHGSEHNVSLEFATRVLAEHYVFSGDGASGNPEDSVIKTVVEGRLKADPSTPFTLWFTTSETRPSLTDKARSQKKMDVMARAIKEANDAQHEHPDLIEVRVLDDAEKFHTIDV
jgi:beta-lactamase superfamily II metal-dependent hydrolase